VIFDRMRQARDARAAKALEQETFLAALWVKKREILFFTAMWGSMLSVWLFGDLEASRWKAPFMFAVVLGWPLLVGEEYMRYRRGRKLSKIRAAAAFKEGNQENEPDK